MRVANKTMYEMIKFNLAGLSEEMASANRVVSSGKRILDLSDDPVGLTQSLKIKSTLSSLDQLGKNITLGKSWLTASESALNHVQDVISEARTLSVQMASATVGVEQRKSASQIVQQILDEIISLANTEMSGRYIFSGSKTDTLAFDSSGSYGGDNTPFAVKIGKDAAIKVGNDGQAVFGTLFTTLSTLRDDLLGNNVSGVQASIDSLTDHFEEISNHISEIGSKSLRMEIKEKIFLDLKISNTDRLSRIEDADIAEAIIDLKGKELAYQATLASSARVMELSLLDYLK